MPAYTVIHQCTVNPAEWQINPTFIFEGAAQRKTSGKPTARKGIASK